VTPGETAYRESRAGVWTNGVREVDLRPALLHGRQILIQDLRTGEFLAGPTRKACLIVPGKIGEILAGRGDIVVDDEYVADDYAVTKEHILRYRATEKAREKMKEAGA